MLSFLRKIRRSAIESGLSGTYVKYALGEIFLIVIGILIALQISEWREDQLARKQEHKLLKQTVRTLSNNKKILEEEIKDLVRNNLSADTIINAIENKLPYSPGFDQHFHYSRNNTMVVLERSGYESLMNTGLEILLSDTISIKIVDLFENTYAYMEKIVSEVRTGKTDLEIHIRKNFIPSSRQVKPVDYDQLLNDHYYLASLRHIRGIRGWHLSQLNHSLNETLETLAIIELELSRRW